ncbi:hypothetical protein ACFZCL_04345 [Streptomyces sp. NPDC008159]|uniref:hypothetical protein n=1 Tax=Streptomyces sp. NPDC008159 TaxID=3364817 RepID=UPI0036E8D25F
MPTIPHPTRGVTTCDRCGAAIRWATCTSGTYKGRRVPLNALPSPMGGYAARYNGHGGLVVRELDREFPQAEDARLEWPALLHWHSCTGQQNPQPPAVQAPRSRPARRRPTVQPPLWGSR